jgi:hypothetical protein
MRELVARHARHRFVGDHDVRRAVSQDQTLAGDAVTGGRGLVAGVAEHALHECPDRQVVVDDEGFHGVLPAAIRARTRQTS